MYADYEFYKNKYFGNVISEEDFPRFEDRAEDKLNYLTMDRIVNLLIKKPNGDFELNDSKISFSIKKAVCRLAEAIYDIEQADKMYRDTVGFTADNGITTGKVVKSVSAGAESITYSDTVSQNSAISDIVKADKRTQDNYYFEIVREYLGMTGLLSQAL